MGSEMCIRDRFKRLRLFFNNDVDIYIDSEQGQFTKIQIEIPFWGSEAMEDVSGIDSGR